MKLNGTHVKGAAKEDLEEIAKAYGEAAKVAVQAGFQMVMLHGAHGWLLDQMLSPKFNTRTDEFGGSFENRCRFPMMILDAIRKRVGHKILIEYVSPDVSWLTRLAIPMLTSS